jgi:5-methylcytosine-specific restriction endonuclease McrA
LVWQIADDAAWFPDRDRCYRHYCGASAQKRGKSWTPKTTTGSVLSSRGTASDAVGRLQRLFDHRLFWTFRQYADGDRVWGVIPLGPLEHLVRPIETGEQYQIFAFCSSTGCEYPDFLRYQLTERFFRISHCVRCSVPMSKVTADEIRCFDQRILPRGTAFLSCACGYPVWRMDSVSYRSAFSKIYAAFGSWKRTQRLKAAGGNHTKLELQDISALQLGRCLYCNAKFSDACPHSIDHLLPVTQGGSDFAFNIVLACRNCNSRRGNIPFRTFCRILSTAQNGRILASLQRRVVAFEEQGATEALDGFIRGLAAHDPKHARYALIRQMGVGARRNASLNRLLPVTPAAILKRAASLTKSRDGEAYLLKESTC